VKIYFITKGSLFSRCIDWKRDEGMKKVLVTGASGFIGSHVVKANLAKGHAVRALVLPDDPAESSLRSSGVEVIIGDMCNPEAVKKAASGVDLIFHCAAVVTDWAPKKLFQEVTVGGAEHICSTALETGVSRLVYISTCDVFGIDETQVMNESLPLRPWKEPYPDHKIEAEKIVWHYQRDKGLPVTMVYPLWVYGEGDLTFVPLLADAIIKKELLFWRRDAIVWPTYIDNLIDLLMLIAEDDRAVGNGYLVHDGESTTLQEFCAGIARTLGRPPATLHLPYFAVYLAAIVMELTWKILRKKTRPLLTTYTVKNLGSRFRFSIEKAERELGWTPKISYQEGFARTMVWLRTLDLEYLKQK